MGIISNHIGVPFWNRAHGSGGDKPLPPELKEALVGVWIADQNTNDSPTRNIIKNKIKDAGGDFEILNAAYSEGSGYKNGAFVTDGVSDLIVSQKKMSEILNGSNEATVISMIANLDSEQILCNSNFSNTNGYNVRNTLDANGVTSILGYTDKNGITTNLNLIMGDRNSIKLIDKVNFNSNYIFYPATYNGYAYKVAWYWTLIAKRVLTTDEINQVIAYYNLDKYVTPDIYYDVKKQGLTNENHTEFGDKLIDYSGNGRDMQLYNFDWNENSGIGSGVYDGMLVTDGVKSFGKVEGVPIYKDYTVVSERALLEPPGNGNIGAFVSKAYASSQGAFILDEVSNSWSFGTATKVNVQSGIKTIYQTKYVYNGQSITAGEGVDSTNMWLATLRENDARFSKIAITILMVFQYSMCEFLMERQLKKRRLAKLSK